MGVVDAIGVNALWLGLAGKVERLVILLMSFCLPGDASGGRVEAFRPPPRELKKPARLLEGEPAGELLVMPPAGAEGCRFLLESLMSTKQTQTLCSYGQQQIKK